VPTIDPRLPKQYDIKKEKWVEVRGAEGLYEISQFGRVRKLGTRTYYRGKKRKTDKKQVVRTRKLIKPVDYKENVYVRLSIEGTRHNFRLDKLVADHFCSKVSSDAKIRFKDGDYTNCAAENLTRRPKRKLTETKVRNIKVQLAEGYSLNYIASKYKTNKSTIRKIRDGKIWRKVFVSLD